MQKKFLRAFAISVILLGVHGPSYQAVSGIFTTREFEDYISRAPLMKWTCEWDYKEPEETWASKEPTFARQTNLTYNNYSYSPNVQTQIVYNPYYQTPLRTYRCGGCEAEMRSIARFVPIVTFKWEGPDRVMELTWPYEKDGGYSPAKICGNFRPQPHEKLASLWDKAFTGKTVPNDIASVLQSLWTTAQIEDSRNTSPRDSNDESSGECTPLRATRLKVVNEYKYRKSTGCCTIN